MFMYMSPSGICTSPEYDVYTFVTVSSHNLRCNEVIIISRNSFRNLEYGVALVISISIHHGNWVETVTLNERI